MYIILNTNLNYARVVTKSSLLDRMPDKQRVSTPILLQGFANSDKLESNPNKQLSDERKLQHQDLSPISGGQARESLHHANSHLVSPRLREEAAPPQILSPSHQPGQSPRMVQSSSPLSLPTSPVLTPASSAAAQLSFANPFGLAASRAGFLPGLPPGINPFFPHAGMMLSNPFQRFPGKTGRSSVFCSHH